MSQQKKAGPPVPCKERGLADLNHQRSMMQDNQSGRDATHHLQFKQSILKRNHRLKFCV